MRALFIHTKNPAKTTQLAITQKLRTLVDFRTSSHWGHLVGYLATKYIKKTTGYLFDGESVEYRSVLISRS